MKTFSFWFVAILYLTYTEFFDLCVTAKLEGENIPIIMEVHSFESKHTSPTKFLNYMAQKKFRATATGGLFTITRNVNGQGVVTWKGEVPEKDGKIQRCEFTYTFDGEIPKILQETPKKYKDYFLRSASKINDEISAE